jgi:transposase
MRAYSLDLRMHLMQAVESGISKAEAAHVFGVSVRTIDRYLKQRAESGALAARPIPGRPRHITPAQDALLAAQLRPLPMRPSLSTASSGSRSTTSGSAWPR